MSDVREAAAGPGHGEGGVDADASRTAGKAVSALQAVLAAEHAVIYGYGVVGPRLSGRRRKEAERDWDAHRARRDQLESMLRQRGAVPTPAATAYQLPERVSGAGAALRLAIWLEEGVTRAYVGLVAVDDAALRAFAGTAVRESALRAARWRGYSVPFPGLPASATR